MSYVKNAVLSMKRFAQRNPVPSNLCVTIKCPLCSFESTVRDESEGLDIPAIRCRCGNAIHGSVGYYAQL